MRRTGHGAFTALSGRLFSKGTRMHPDIIAPPSKSFSHRLLVAAALAHGTSHLSHVLESEDTACTREALSALGTYFERTAPGCFTVSGLGGVVRSPAGSGPDNPLPLFVGESGSTCRLLTAVLAAGKGWFHLHGAGRMHDRPVGELARVLEALGARFSFSGKADCPPFVLTASGLDASALPDATVEIGCDESSQYLSGLLLAAPLGKAFTLRLGGRRVVSWPYVSLTLEILERFGIHCGVEDMVDGRWQPANWRTLGAVRPGELRFRVTPGGYRAGEYVAEGDWSGASYFLAAGAIGPKPVRVKGLNPDSLQGDAALLDILAAMGGRMAWDEGDITVYPSRLRGIETHMGNCPDLVPTVAALAAHAAGATRITGVAHAKIKESDRIAAPAAELTKAGCSVAIMDDGMLITPPAGGVKAPADGVVFSAHNDHRLAMSLCLLGLPGLTGAGFAVPLDNPGCVAKSFPHFWELWAAVAAG